VGSAAHPVPFDWTLFDKTAPPEVLLLDYDGTLAPFRPERMQAFPYEGIRDGLQRLGNALPGRVAIISGRPIDELRALLGKKIMLDLYGAHGWEQRDRHGNLKRWDPPDHLVRMLETAASGIKPAIDEARLDVKQGSVAVHVRGLSEIDVHAIAEQVDRVWKPLTRDGQLRLRAFDGGWELRIDARTKATAVDEIRDQHRAGTRFAYLGDDDTDEDAFVKLGPDDWPILVRETARPSHARFWLKPPEELLRFLHAFTNA